MGAAGDDAPVPYGSQWSETYAQFLSRCRSLSAAEGDSFRLVEEGFLSSRGTVLYGKHLLHPPESPAAASILFLQGFGDHCNSPYHAEQMLTLARMGYDVHGFDHESLGRSEDRCVRVCVRACARACVCVRVLSPTHFLVRTTGPGRAASFRASMTWLMTR